MLLRVLHCTSAIINRGVDWVLYSRVNRFTREIYLSKSISFELVVLSVVKEIFDTTRNFGAQLQQSSSCRH